MKSIKKLVYLMPPFITSYIFNCYVYSTFDFSKFPDVSKILSYLVAVIIFGILYVIEDEIYKENIKLSKENKILKEHAK